MRTDTKKVGDTIIVTLEGTMDFETAIPLREELNRVLRSARRSATSGKDAPAGASAREYPTDAVKIVFDLEGLEFVGSSGISSFVQALKEFNAAAPSRPIYCNVKSEFKRIIRAFDEGEQFDIEEGKRLFDQ